LVAQVGVAVALAPRRAELTVEHVVDGDGPEQMPARRTATASMS
jgi:hypothetical protein